MADEKDKSQKPKKEPKGERQGKKGAGAPAAASEPKAEAKPREPEPKVPARLRVRYEQEIRPTLMRELKIENPMRAPRLQKIVINMSLSEARDNVKVLDAAVEELKVVTGQKPVITRARKAISNFKLREGMPIGVMVTLRRERMYEFFDRLVNCRSRACATSAESATRLSTGAATTRWGCASIRFFPSSTWTRSRA